MSFVLKGITLLLLLYSLNACGGRVARPVVVENSYDEKLSCLHLEGEYKSNLERMLDLQNERTTQSQQNAPKLLLGAAGLMFMNFNDSEKKEIQALSDRNMKISDLKNAKNCDFEVITYTANEVNEESIWKIQMLFFNNLFQLSMSASPKIQNNGRKLYLNPLFSPRTSPPKK